jgi:hypothetical protein
MGRRIAVTLLLAFAARSAFASHSSGGHSSGSHASGGRSSGGHAWGGPSRGHAVPRQPGGYGHGSVAPYRHPRAGNGSGSYYGHYGYGRPGYGRYGYGRGYYGYGRYPYYRYGYYPYYGYGYYPYGWAGLGLGLSFYYNGGSSPAPYYGSGYYPPEDPYAGDRDEPDRGYSDHDLRRDEGREGTAELRLRVRPEDASVYVDGEFRGMAGQLSRLRLTPGRHRLEIVRPGYRVAERDVDVGPEGSASLEVELER